MGEIRLRNVVDKKVKGASARIGKRGGGCQSVQEKLKERKGREKRKAIIKKKLIRIELASKAALCTASRPPSSFL
jgi:hypothetical protein